MAKAERRRLPTVTTSADNEPLIAAKPLKTKVKMMVCTVLDLRAVIIVFIMFYIIP